MVGWKNYPHNIIPCLFTHNFYLNKKYNKPNFSKCVFLSPFTKKNNNNKKIKNKVRHLKKKNDNIFVLISQQNLCEKLLIVLYQNQLQIIIETLL